MKVSAKVQNIIYILRWVLAITFIEATVLLVAAMPAIKVSAQEPPYELTDNRTQYTKLFYLGESPGEERVYIVASAEPLQELENLLAVYDRAGGGSEKQDALSRLLETVESVGELGRTGVWQVFIDHR